MLEALILQHLATHASRNLNAQASRILTTAPNEPSPPTGESDSTRRQTPSSASAGSSSHAQVLPQTEQFLQSYMKMQIDLEKIHSLWPISQAVLSSPESIRPKSDSTNMEDILTCVLRKGKMAFDIEPTKLDDIVIPDLLKPENKGVLAGPEDLFKDEENYYHFAWPIVLHSQNAVAHATSFGRALLSEISERLDIGYTVPSIE